MALDDQTLQRVWAQVAAELSHHSELSPMGRSVVTSAAPLGILHDTVLMAVPNQYSKTVFDGKNGKIVTETLSHALGQSVRIAVSVDESLNTPDEVEAEDISSTPPSPTRSTPASSLEFSTPATPDDIFSQAAEPESHHGAQSHEESGVVTPISSAPSASTTSSTSSISPSPSPDPTPVQDQLDHQTFPDSSPESTHLNPNYTFDTFVIGASNRFATAAATATAENPGNAYNPLFIFGGSGLGKTHLLHAIGHEALRMRPNLRVKYVNSEEFTNEFINAIATETTYDFQNRYRAVNILLIDDIQFLQGKERTIEEFFHTFNALHNAGAQLVIASDQPPKRLGGFEERMRSRFESGLQVDIQPADLETRIAILSRKAEQENVDVDISVLSYIASRFITNIRELEGALVRVTAFASLSNQPVTQDLAAMVLKDNFPDAQPPQITASMIKAQTAAYFDVTVDALISSSRSRALTEARQVAMYLCRELTELSLPSIGQEFGGRDHTTVMYANRKIAENMKSKPQVYNHVQELTSLIRNAARQGH